MHAARLQRLLELVVTGVTQVRLQALQEFGIIAGMGVMTFLALARDKWVVQALALLLCLGFVMTLITQGERFIP